LFGCHGPGGEGGQGAILARPTLSRAPDDAALFEVIKNGLRGTEMPGAFAMTDHEIWQVAAFVKTLGRPAVSSVAFPGDAGRGEQVFRAKGCVQCHTVKKQGGRMGPDLTEIGLRRSPDYLREALLAPGASLPEGFMQVRVVTAAGRRMTGILLNEDTYSVQIRDLSDQLHSFWKHELSQFQKERGKTPMPSYRDRLSAAELADVIAYLASLRGES
jgi:putative heme-binding domain-containing protein